MFPILSRAGKELQELRVSKTLQTRFSLSSQKQNLPCLGTTQSDCAVSHSAHLKHPELLQKDTGEAGKKMGMDVMAPKAGLNIPSDGWTVYLQP